jgi:succinyl-diaminopimelate desuccinylase
MAARCDDARAAARRHVPVALAGLEQWLRIPSVSGDPAHRHDVDRAADWLAARLATMTRSVRVVRSAHTPVVLARVPARRPNAPFMIVYGHLDVKPPGPGWTSEPFEPVRRGGLLFARGASDDKGQLMVHVAAVEAWASIGGPPLDVVFIVDGAEEIGSPGLKPMLDGHRDLLGGNAVAVVVSDTKMAGPGRPSLTVSQRGMLGLKVEVSTARGAVHAGRYGGAVVDPTQVLAAAILRAARAVGRLRCTSHLPGRPDERTTTCGALSVTSIQSGSAAGAIPASAKATLDIRLPPGLPAAPTLKMIAGAVGGNRQPRTHIELTCVAATTGTVLRQTSTVRENIDDACRLAFGVPTVTVASGGSIPAVEHLYRRFERPPILLGFGPADDGAHGPDERIALSDWSKSVEMSACFLDLMSRSAAAPPMHYRGTGFGDTLIPRDGWGAAAFS